MKEITTKRGFKCKVDTDRLNDMRFVRLIKNLETNRHYIEDLSIFMLGEEQNEKLCKFIEEKDGRIPVDTFTEEIGEIITLSGEAVKKS